MLGQDIIARERRVSDAHRRGRPARNRRIARIFGLFGGIFLTVYAGYGAWAGIWGETHPAWLGDGEATTYIYDGGREAPPPTITQAILKQGDSLTGLLVREGVDRTVAHEVSTELGRHAKLRRLQAGEGVSLEWQTGGMLSGVRLILEGVRVVEARRDAEAWEGNSWDRMLTHRAIHVEGEIESSLYEAAQAEDVPAEVIVSLIRLYSWSVDFQRDIRRGDHFSLLYGIEEDDRGEFVRASGIEHATLAVGGRGESPEQQLWRYETDGKNGPEAGFYDMNGRSARRFLMRTPIDGARLSSGYGMRKHPVLGYSRLHAGVDFAAPSGTPIYAAGDGVVEVRGRKGGYGKYIRIRHANNHKTAYGHLRGYAKGVKVGGRVSQGAVIGYVGSTGMSTGPHLHYEVHQGGKKINPRNIKEPPRERLEGEELAGFRLVQQEVARTVSRLRSRDFALGEGIVDGPPAN